MSIYKPHEEEKLLVRKWIASSYYDHPDGEDLMGKLWFTTKIAFAGTTVFGILYANLPPPPNFKMRLVRFFRFVGPAVGIAATFTCVTYYSTVIRKKDDEWNYLLGGTTAGAILGPALASPTWTAWGAIFGGIIAYSHKVAKMNGMSLIQDTRRQQLSSYYLRTLDTSILPEIKGNWTKDPK